jgi:hypothetical protein
VRSSKCGLEVEGEILALDEASARQLGLEIEARARLAEIAEMIFPAGLLGAQRKRPRRYAT